MRLTSHGGESSRDQQNLKLDEISETNGKEIELLEDPNKQREKEIVILGHCDGTLTADTTQGISNRNKL